MNINNNMGISFGAKIKVTPYLNEALYQLSNVRAVTDFSLKERADFVKALDLISQDKTMDTFEINGVPGSKIVSHTARKAQIVVDGKNTKTIDGWLGVHISDACQCAKSVVNFAKERYGANALKNPLSEQAEEIKDKTKKMVFALDSIGMDITGLNYDSTFKMHKDYEAGLDKSEQKFLYP